MLLYLLFSDFALIFLLLSYQPPVPFAKKNFFLLFYVAFCPNKKWSQPLASYITKNGGQISHNFPGWLEIIYKNNLPINHQMEHWKSETVQREWILSSPSRLLTFVHHKSKWSISDGNHEIVLLNLPCKKLPGAIICILNFMKLQCASIYPET